jgi:hypothetical protein
MKTFCRIPGMGLRFEVEQSNRVCGSNYFFQIHEEG